MNVITQARAEGLWEEVAAWLDENAVNCDERIYQSASVQEALYDLAARCVKIVGFADPE